MDQVTPGLVALENAAEPSFLASEACFRKYCCVPMNCVYNVFVDDG